MASHCRRTEVALREELVDDDDGRREGRVAFVEESTLDER